MINWIKRLFGSFKPTTLCSTTNDFKIEAKAIVVKRGDVFWYRDKNKSDTFMVISSDVKADDTHIFFFDPALEPITPTTLPMFEFHNALQRDVTEAKWDFYTKELTY